jgi:hypothetical protein
MKHGCLALSGLGLTSLFVFGVTLEAINDPKELSAIPFTPWDFITYGLIAIAINSLGTAVTGRALNRYNAWAAIRKRAKAASFLTPVGCHTWRATGITIYLENDGRLEHVGSGKHHHSLNHLHRHVVAVFAIAKSNRNASKKV